MIDVRWSEPTAPRARFQGWCGCLASAVGMMALLWGCAAVPRQYVRMAEPGLTLTELTAHPERYRGKAVLLGGAIVEEAEEGHYLLLRVTNRPLDRDYVPHRPVDRHGPEGGHYWVAVVKQQMPREYRQWARMTVVGRVTGTQRLGNEPVVALIYVRGWGASGTHDESWEYASDSNYEPTVPAGLGGELGGISP